MTAPTTTLTREILDLDEQFWEAVKRGDRQKLGRLTADRFTFVMEQGVNEFSRDEFLGMIFDGDFKLTGYRVDKDKARVREIAPGVALAAYPAHWEYTEGKGKPQATDAFDVGIWVRKGDTWQCTSNTESRAAKMK